MNINSRYSSIEQITGTYLNNPAKVKSESDNTDFSKVLNEKANGLKFSKHAGERLATRNISLTQSQIDRLNHGTEKAEAKGIKESLMIMDDMAFIVNIKNNTVVTAMSQTDSKENVFTNIDGAVII